MPRHSIDYSKCLMYKIVCKDLSVKDLYVGHTTSWTGRKSTHKSSCNNVKFDCKIYNFMRQTGGWENWDMILIEEFSCVNDLEASARERFLIETLNANLNSYRPSITREEKKEYDKQYRSTHEYKIEEGHFKRYYIQNKETMSKQQKENRQLNKIICECGKKICKYSIKQHVLTKHHINIISNKDIVQ
jgi:hypothetical protein